MTGDELHELPVPQDEPLTPDDIQASQEVFDRLMELDPDVVQLEQDEGLAEVDPPKPDPVKVEQETVEPVKVEQPDISTDAPVFVDLEQPAPPPVQSEAIDDTPFLDSRVMVGQEALDELAKLQGDLVKSEQESFISSKTRQLQREARAAREAAESTVETPVSPPPTKAAESTVEPSVSPPSIATTSTPRDAQGESEGTEDDPDGQRKAVAAVEEMVRLMVTQSEQLVRIQVALDEIIGDGITLKG